MGVAGVGKTTVGRILATELGWAFYDADEFHSAENVEKMAGGIPLTNEDREPWLNDLQALVRRIDSEERSAVLACSALTESFRARLRAAGDDLRFIFLRDSPAKLRDRLVARTDHYMKAEMLESQIEALEEPADATVIDVGDSSPEQVVARIRRALAEER